MPTKIILAIIFLTMFVVSCSEQKPMNNGLQNNILAVQTWIDSLVGKNEKQLSEMFPEQIPARSTWTFDNKQELVLTYPYRDTQLDFYFLDQEVVTASMLFMSK